MVPSSREQLIEYCLRNLGAPVLEINVDEDQVSDRVDEALQFYQEYHSDAVVKVYMKHQITEQDRENKWIYIPDGVISVQRIFPVSQSYMTSNIYDIRYQFFLNDMYNLGFAGRLSEYVQTKEYLSLLENMLVPLPQTRHSRHANRLNIFIDWDVYLPVGDFVIVEGYRIVDPDENTKVYNDMYLKRYTTALIKRQWGINMKKFEGMQLPGGVTLNGQQIFDEANEEIQRLEEEIRLNWEQPLDFFVG